MTRGMGTWNRLTGLRGGAGGPEEASQRAHLQIRVVRGHRHQRGEGWVERSKRWKWEAPVTVPTIKKKKKRNGHRDFWLRKKSPKMEVAVTCIRLAFTP